MCRPGSEAAGRQRAPRSLLAGGMASLLGDKFRGLWWPEDGSQQVCQEPGEPRDWGECSFSQEPLSSCPFLAMSQSSSGLEFWVPLSQAGSPTNLAGCPSPSGLLVTAVTSPLPGVDHGSQRALCQIPREGSDPAPRPHPPQHSIPNHPSTGRD